MRPIKSEYFFEKINKEKFQENTANHFTQRGLDAQCSLSFCIGGIHMNYFTPQSKFRSIKFGSQISPKEIKETLDAMSQKQKKSVPKAQQMSILTIWGMMLGDISYSRGGEIS